MAFPVLFETCPLKAASYRVKLRLRLFPKAVQWGAKVFIHHGSNSMVLLDYREMKL